MAKKTEQISNRDDIGEIDEILKKLNSGETDIDTMSVDVKRASELISLCKNKLKKSEEELKKILEV